MLVSLEENCISLRLVQPTNALAGTSVKLFGITMYLRPLHSPNERVLIDLRLGGNIKVSNAQPRKATSSMVVMLSPKMFSLVREPFPSKAREGMVLSFEFLGIITSRNEPLAYRLQVPPVE